MDIPAQYKQLIGVWQGYSIYIVNGEYIRSPQGANRTDFAQCGNPQAYPDLIPDMELWGEVAAILVSGVLVFCWNDFIADMFHEWFECQYMKATGCSYEEAHGHALTEERKVRAILGLPTDAE